MSSLTIRQAVIPNHGTSELPAGTCGYRTGKPAEPKNLTEFAMDMAEAKYYGDDKKQEESSSLK